LALKLKMRLQLLYDTVEKMRELMWETKMLKRTVSAEAETLLTLEKQCAEDREHYQQCFFCAGC
jgi:hypothetical protein